MLHQPLVTAAGLARVSIQSSLHTPMPRSALALLTALLVACDFTGTPGIDLAVATEQSAYQASSPDALTPIRLRLENTGRQPLEIGRCGSHLAAYVDRSRNSQWQEVALVAIFCLAAYDMAPLQLAPGATVVTEPILLRHGRYRFRVPYGPIGGPADARLAMSNEAIVAPPP